MTGLVENIRMTSGAPLGPKALSFASTVARSATERVKPESARDDIFTARNLDRTRDRLEREQKSYFARADKAVLADFVRRALALPKEQRIAAIDEVFGGEDDAAVRARIDELYAKTRLFDLAERKKMLGETVDQLHERKDPLVELGFGIGSEIDRFVERTDRWSGAIGRLRPQWRRAVIAHAGKPVAPDANSTLRVSFAHVQGYVPRDGLRALPQTTLKGVLEKHTGEEPFDVPDSILAAAREKRFGRWKDPELGDVPVNFLADADTTGGNSGSPVLNGRGELVGMNFDRVWENVANDFGFNPEVARNVTVDVRYLLWILEEVEKADELLGELGVKK